MTFNIEKILTESRNEREKIARNLNDAFEGKPSLDSVGKPTLNLTYPEKVIHVPSPKDFDNLMQIYECSGYKDEDGMSLTDNNFWHEYGEETCIRLGDRGTNRGFNYGSKSTYSVYSLNVVSTKEFYDSQNPKISSKVLKELNQWFDKHKPNRKSKLK